MRLSRGRLLLLVFLVALPLGAASPQSTTPAEPPFARTPQRMARGKYLVEGAAHCFECHSEKDDHTRIMIPASRGGGRVLRPDEGRITRPYFLVCPNISPDKETGAGTWTDAQFARAIREGIGHDGRQLHPFMPYWNFRNLSDEDLASIVVYVRSIPPVHHVLPKRHLANEPAYPPPGFLEAIQPPPLPAGAPAQLRRGEYLVHVANCTACHTTRNAQNQPIPHMLFGGGNLFLASGKWSATANLTRDSSGIAYYDEAQFIRTIRTGRVGARVLSNAMPWRVYRNLSDDDLKAIFAYLRTMPPLQHRVDNTEPPTLCPKDGHMHGYGDRN